MTPTPRLINHVTVPTIERINQWLADFPHFSVINVETLIVAPNVQQYRVWYWHTSK